MRTRASDQEYARNSPERHYSAKSKIAGNMRSIKKTQKRGGQIVPNNNEYKSIAYTLSDEQKALNQRRCQEIDVQSTNL